MSFRERLSARWRHLTGPRFRDVLVIVLSGIAGAIEIYSSVNQGVGGPPIVVVACVVVGLVALWWRRRYPLQVFAIGVVVYVLSGSLSALGFGLLSLAVRRRDRILILATVLSAAVFWMPKYWDSFQTGLRGALTAVVGALLWTLIGAYIGARRDLLNSLRERAVRAERERELRVDQARSLERERIAREMHDVVAHKVSLIALQAGGLEVNPAAGPAKVEEMAGLIGETARQALQDLRQVLGVLQGTVARGDLVPVPGLADVEELVHDSVKAGARVELQLRLAKDVQVPDPLGRAVYRVVQEGLTNVHKHARGAACAVLVQGSQESGLQVKVTNAVPVAAGSLLPGSGMGLEGLRERLALIGGSLRAGPNHLGGWEISATLPAWDSVPGKLEQRIGAE